MAGGQISSALRHLRQLLGARQLAGGSDAQLLQRFVAQRDEDAFAALVQRHGPIVLGVCRRMLTKPSDVEDAFQATFLILLRKAASIAHPERLGAWLHGVAYRVAVRARHQAARRRACESQVVAMPGPDPAAGKPLRPARESVSHSFRSDQLCCVFSADGKIAACGNNGQLFIWDVATDKVTPVSRDRRVGACVTALSPDGKILATGVWQPGRQGAAEDTSSITLWDLAKKETEQPAPPASRLTAKPDRKLREVDKLPGYVTALAFSPDGKLLASATQHQQDPSATLRLWDVATGKEVHCWIGHRGRVNALAFAPNGRRLASASSDGTVLVWKVE